MTSPSPLTPASASVDRSLALLVEEWTTRLQAGEAADEEAFLAKHPAHADELRLLLPALRAMAELGRSGVSIAAGVSPEEAMGRLGDFRIVREIGRGGMGIVYEAEQVSLQRRVALKLLPFAATMDARRLQRFQNETLAAAGLHHTNIVPVHFVGCERGVHFYAMQLIEGCTLAAVLRELHWEAGPLAPVKGPARAALASVGEEPPTEAHRPAALMKETPGLAGLSTQGPKRSKEYFQAVARLGVQVAEALDYAHERGVIHRDIKPANLLLDERGVPWVTDFGLAHLQHAEVSLTMTGDLVGTLRYMSPEQALAGPTTVDHRTDVYSLGATLYELLTLRPAFGGTDRQELLRQVAFEEPARPRRLVREVPAELEIIVLKAMEKNPQDRYATARELADDLRRWLDDRSILARRPSLVRLAARWSRRHKPLVGAALAVLVMAAVLGGGTWLWWAQKRAGAEGEARVALREAAGLLEQERWPEALSAARRAEGVLAGVGADPELRRQARTLVEDLEMARRLQEASLQGAAVMDEHFDLGGRHAAYAAAFREYGLDVDGLDPEEAAEQIRARPIHRQLVAALDEWALDRRALKAEGWKQRLAVARAVDPDVWRNRLRDFLEGKAQKTLEEVVAADPEGDWPARTLGRLATIVVNGSGMRVEALLRQAQQRHPDDFWINETLAQLVARSKPPRLEEAIRFHSVAVALRPQSPGAWLNLGTALRNKGRLEEAEAAHREAIRLKADYAAAHNALGRALAGKGRLDQAIAAYREAIHLRKNFAEAYFNLGNALRRKGQMDEAIGAYREAIHFRKDLAEAHFNLGSALHVKGQMGGAIAAYREALRIKKDFTEARHNLGIALREKGDVDGAIAAFREVILIKKDSPLSYDALGNALLAKGDVDGAIAGFREAIHFKKDYPDAHCNLGRALLAKRDVDGAIAACRAAIDLKKDHPDAHSNLGDALVAKGDGDGAIAAFRETIHLKKDYPEAHRKLATVLRARGDVDGAIAVFREAIRIKKDDALAHCNLGITLAEQKKLPEAEAAFRKAIELKPDFAEADYGLGNALIDQKKLAEAETAYRKAIELKPDYAEAHGALGFALLQQGQFTQAESSTRRARGLLPPDHPLRPMVTQQLNQCRHCLALEKKLPDVLAGKLQPANAAERAEYAGICLLTKRFAAAARLFTRAFADPKLANNLQAGHRYNAACAAALAGCGQGKDADHLDTRERERLRQQALDWLRADLTALRNLLEKDKDKVTAGVAQTMQDWLGDTDFAGVRGPEAIGKLPEAERQAWQKLWSDVADTLTKAQKKAAPDKK